MIAKFNENPSVMSEEKKEEQRGDGTDFIKHQKAIDKAINEKRRSQSPDGKLNAADVENEEREYKPGVDVKETGRTKQ